MVLKMSKTPTKEEVVAMACPWCNKRTTFQSMNLVTLKDGMFRETKRCDNCNGIYTSKYT